MEDKGHKECAKYAQKPRDEKKKQDFWVALNRRIGFLDTLSLLLHIIYVQIVLFFTGLTRIGRSFPHYRGMVVGGLISNLFTLF
jgi:hypothetical protein